MRWLNYSSIVLLGLAACSQENPVFDLMTEGSSGTAATTGAGPGPTGTTTPQPTTGPGDTSTTIGTTAGVDETGTSTTMDTTVMTTHGPEPQTSGPPPDTSMTNDSEQTSDATSMDPDTGTTAEPPAECGVTKSEDIPDRLVTREGGDDFPCSDDTIFKGSVTFDGVGIEFHSTGPNCGEPIDMGTYTLGTGWDPALAPASACATAKIQWDKSDPNKCQIGTLVIQDVVSQHYLLIASFYPMLYNANTTPLPIAVDLTESCCPADMPDCCTLPPPGDLKILVKGKTIGPGLEDQIVQTNELIFHNLDSYVDPICIAEQGPSVVHANWYAYKPGP
jgi:hypothetical protein